MKQNRSFYNTFADKDLNINAGPGPDWQLSGAFSFNSETDSFSKAMD